MKLNSIILIAIASLGITIPVTLAQRPSPPPTNPPIQPHGTMPNGNRMNGARMQHGSMILLLSAGYAFFLLICPYTRSKHNPDAEVVYVR